MRATARSRSVKNVADTKLEAQFLRLTSLSADVFQGPFVRITALSPGPQLLLGNIYTYMIYIFLKFGWEWA